MPEQLCVGLGVLRDATIAKIHLELKNYIVIFVIRLIFWLFVVNIWYKLWLKWNSRDSSSIFRLISSSCWEDKCYLIVLRPQSQKIFKLICANLKYWMETEWTMWLMGFSLTVLITANKDPINGNIESPPLSSIFYDA